MSLHDSVSTPTEEEPNDFDSTSQCMDCGSTRFRQQLYQSYVEDKIADTTQGWADYEGLEHQDTYDSDPWACVDCGRVPEDDDLLSLLSSL